MKINNISLLIFLSQISTRALGHGGAVVNCYRRPPTSFAVPSDWIKCSRCLNLKALGIALKLANRWVCVSSALVALFSEIGLQSILAKFLAQKIFHIWNST